MGVIMPKANPKAWFTSHIAKISYRSVDKWAKYSEQLRPYFPTWKEAHDWMMERAGNRLKRAEGELKIAQRHCERVAAMQNPAPAQEPGEQIGGE